MNFRLIALASCVALGSIALGGKAQAADFFTSNDTTLTSAGSMAASCNISTAAAPGVLATIDASSLSSVASPATFGLTCTGPTNVIVGITAISGSGGVAATTATVTANLREDAADVASSTRTAASASTALALGTSAKAMTLVHSVTDSSPLPLGAYNLSTIVSVIPQ